MMKKRLNWFSKKTLRCLVCSVIIVLGIIFFLTGICTTAAQEDLPVCEKHYESIQIETGASLWSYAEKYAEAFGLSAKEYVEEIKRINGLPGDRIISGSRLILVTDGK